MQESQGGILQVHKLIGGQGPAPCDLKQQYENTQKFNRTVKVIHSKPLMHLTVN